MKLTVLFIGLLLCLTFSGRVYAQELRPGSGMEMGGFRVPDYDEKGGLRAQLYGVRAKMHDDGTVDITDLRIEIYQENQVSLTLYAPTCVYNTQTRVAQSDGKVLIDGSSVSVVGRGFVWVAGGGRFEILHDAKVLVKPDAKSELKGWAP